MEVIASMHAGRPIYEANCIESKFTMVLAAKNNTALQLLFVVLRKGQRNSAEALYVTHHGPSARFPVTALVSTAW